MIAGIGVDLIDRRRVERELSEGAWRSTEGVFTDSEIRGCGKGKRRCIRLSVCFAAKEAALKALGAEISDLGLFREVELVYKSGGQPAITLNSRALSLAQRLGVKRVWISIASAKEHAGAFVVMES